MTYLLFISCSNIYWNDKTSLRMVALTRHVVFHVVYHPLFYSIFNKHCILSLQARNSNKSDSITFMKCSNSCTLFNRSFWSCGLFKGNSYRAQVIQHYRICNFLLYICKDIFVLLVLIDYFILYLKRKRIY